MTADIIVSEAGRHAFLVKHMPALVADEVRYSVLAAQFRRAMSDPTFTVDLFDFGEPGHCAGHEAGWPLLLGDLTHEDCVRLAEVTRPLAYSGVMGEAIRASWFAEAAGNLGIAFDEVVPMRILAIQASPSVAPIPGSARPLRLDDRELFLNWIEAFRREVSPHEGEKPPPNIAEQVAADRYMLWELEGVPVALAGIARRFERSGSIAPVYTPPEHRRHGFASAVVAVQVNRLFAEGKHIVSLFADTDNPASNGCYEKLGFSPYCDMAHHFRA